MAKRKMIPTPADNIAKQIMETYQPQDAQEIQDVVKRIFAPVFSYGSAVRKVMYTTNAIESVNSSFRKVTKKGSFPNEDAVFKLLYLRVQELYQKWAERKVSNWALVRNQLLMDERMAKLMEHYDTTY